MNESKPQATIPEKLSWEPITVKTYRAADAEFGAGAIIDGVCGCSAS